MDFQQKFHLANPPDFKFRFIGINTRKKVLNEKAFRKALAHIIDIDEITHLVEQGFASRSVGPINPVLTKYYNNTITPYEQDLAKADSLMRSCGLKKIEGIWHDDSVPLEFNIISRQVSEDKTIAQIIKAKAEDFGIKVHTYSYDLKAVIKKVSNHDYDIYVGSFSGSPIAFDFTELFGTVAKQPGGLNFTGFGDKHSDSLIYTINYAETENDRRNALFGLQARLHDEATMIFLHFMDKKIAVNKRFTNYKMSSMRPGFDATAFKLVDKE